jgi:hypothetical protein
MIVFRSRQQKTAVSCETAVEGAEGSLLLGTRSALRSLDVVDGDLAGTAVFSRVEGNLLAFDEAAQASALESGGVNEDVLAAVVRLDEAEALHVVVEFYGARIHGNVLGQCGMHVSFQAHESATCGSVRRCLERKSERAPGSA